MVDYTMCMNNDGCEVRKTCYRCMARPIGKRQSWAYYDPAKGSKCNGYLDMDMNMKQQTRGDNV